MVVMVVHAAKTINNKPSLSHQSSTFFRVVFQPSKKMGCFMALYGIVLPTLANKLPFIKPGSPSTKALRSPSPTCHVSSSPAPAEPGSWMAPVAWLLRREKRWMDFKENQSLDMPDIDRYAGYKQW